MDRLGLWIEEETEGGSLPSKTKKRMLKRGRYKINVS